MTLTYFYSKFEQVNTVLTIVRDKLKEHCPHEHLVETGHACPKIITDKVLTVVVLLLHSKVLLSVLVLLL